MSPTATRRGESGAGGAASRLDVRKTYKLYVGGAFPRSESGRSYEVVSAPVGRRGARFLANAAMGSRKDVRDAVVAARAAQPGWAAAAAYNRGQVLYRVAEVMEGRTEQLAAEVAAAEGLTPTRARAVVGAAVDRWVWWAGWTDKLAQVLGGLNPVAGRTSTSARRSRPASSACSRRRRRRCSGSCRSWPRRSAPGTPSSSSRARSGRCPR